MASRSSVVHPGSPFPAVNEYVPAFYFEGCNTRSSSGDDVADVGKFDSLVGDSDYVVVPVAVLAFESSDTVEVLEAVVVLDVVDSSSLCVLSAARRSFRLIRQWTLSREAFVGGSQNVNFGQQASLVPSSRLVQGTEPSSLQTEF